MTQHRVTFDPDTSSADLLAMRATAVALHRVPPEIRAALPECADSFATLDDLATSMEPIRLATLVAIDAELLRRKARLCRSDAARRLEQAERCEAQAAELEATP